MQRKPLHLEDPLPVADLISGLLNRQILPGSTVLVTCRVRDLIDLDGISDKVGQLLGWDQDEIKEYVDNFFGAKGENFIYLYLHCCWALFNYFICFIYFCKALRKCCFWLFCINLIFLCGSWCLVYIIKAIQLYQVRKKGIIHLLLLFCIN